MRAWQVGAAGEPANVLRRVDVETPGPKAGELRVAVAAAAVGMPDVFMCRGAYPLTPSVPFTPGQEVAGVVAGVGEGVDVAVGTRVMGVTSFVDGRGGFADETIIAGSNAYPTPDFMSDVEAAGFRIAFSTAWVALVRRARLVEGETLLVLGAAGASGAAAVALGHALGARVIAVVAGPEKAAYCRELGAAVVVDRREATVKDAVQEATGGRGADAVFDPVGGTPGEDAMRCVANEGRFLAVGFAAGRWPEVNVAALVGHNYSVLGVYMSGYTHDDNERDHRELLALVEAGRLPSLVTQTVGFEDLPSALEQIARGEVIGKIVVAL